MDDLYSALIQGVPTNPQRQAALASALRQQAALGALGAASGDRVMAPQGQRMMSAAQGGAEQLADQNARAAALRFEQQKEASDEGYRAADLAERGHIAEMNDQRMRDLAKLLYQNKLDVQGIKNQGAAAKGKPIDAGTRKELEALDDAVGDIDNAIKTYQDGFGGFGRSSENYLAQKGILRTKDAQAAQNWWANYGRGFTLDEMHRRFGARLTPQEMQRFESFHIDQNMPDNMIRQNLPQIKAQMQKMLQDRIQHLRAGGYAPSFLDAIVPPTDGTPSAAPSQPVSAVDKYKHVLQAQPQQAQPQSVHASSTVQGPQSMLPLATRGVGAAQTPNNGIPQYDPRMLLLNPNSPFSLFSGYGSNGQ